MTTATNPEPGDPVVSALLVDDDRDDFLLTRELLAEVPEVVYRLDWVADYDAGLAAAAEDAHDVFLFDYRLGHKTGLDLLREVRGRGCAGPVILLTGQGEREIDQAAMRAGAADYLEKAGLTATVLERSIRYALQKRRYEVELERKVQERTAELARANAALREADRRKDEFLATLAHELRNPLAPIRNALEIMKLSGGAPHAVDQARGVMDRQVRQMVRLIDDLLDVSRITRGKLQLNPERIELATVIESALEISRPAIDKAGLTLTVSLPPEPVVLTADRVRLAQVFSNLLNNAAKYTEAGGRVSLTVGRTDPAAKPPGVEVRVRDTGVGIPAEVLPRVFDLFTQADRSVSRSQGGLGIGLALVKRLVELHGGTVAVNSDGPGTGTEFVVRLPLGPPPDLSAVHPALPS